MVTLQEHVDYKQLLRQPLQETQTSKEQGRNDDLKLVKSSISREIGKLLQERKKDNNYYSRRNALLRHQSQNRYYGSLSSSQYLELDRLNEIARIRDQNIRRLQEQRKDIVRSMRDSVEKATDPQLTAADSETKQTAQEAQQENADTAEATEPQNEKSQSTDEPDTRGDDIEWPAKEHHRKRRGKPCLPPTLRQDDRKKLGQVDLGKKPGVRKERMRQFTGVVRERTQSQLTSSLGIRHLDNIAAEVRAAVGASRAADILRSCDLEFDFALPTLGMKDGQARFFYEAFQQFLTQEGYSSRFEDNEFLILKNNEVVGTIRNIKNRTRREKREKKKNDYYSYYDRSARKEKKRQAIQSETLLYPACNKQESKAISKITENALKLSQILMSPDLLVRIYQKTLRDNPEETHSIAANIDAGTGKLGKRIQHSAMSGNGLIGIMTETYKENQKVFEKQRQKALAKRKHKDNVNAKKKRLKHKNMEIGNPPSARKLRKIRGKMEKQGKEAKPTAETSTENTSSKWQTLLITTLEDAESAMNDLRHLIHQPKFSEKTRDLLIRRITQFLDRSKGYKSARELRMAELLERMA